MSLAAPWFFVAGLVAAAAVVALHFLARERPRAALLPTARFVPLRPARAPSRSARPSDLLLLLCRALALLLAGLALAQPRLVPRTAPRARIVLVERSRAVARPGEAYDTARALLRAGDRLVAYDTAGARLEPDELAAAPAAWRARGSLTAGLVAALREAAELAPRVDSLELVLVAPLAHEGWDAATALVRSGWRGAITVVQVAAAPPRPAAAVAVTGAVGDDPLAATIARLGAPQGDPAARLVRNAGALTPADSAFAAAGGVVVLWPAGEATGDTVGAVAARGLRAGDEAVVVAPFVRSAAGDTSAGSVVARWVDGAAAATERAVGMGCVREVAVAVPAASDVALTGAMRAFVARLVAPCGGAGGAAAAPLPDSLVAVIAGSGGAMPASLVVRAAAAFPPLSLWLLAGAAAVLILEGALRRRQVEP